MMLTNLSDKKKQMSEIIIATLVGFAIVFGVCGIMGTLNSGYHFVDDHEYLAWTYNLKYNLSFKELLYWNVRDDGNRFRPLYMFFRTVWIYFFGTNLFIHSVIKAIQSAISLVCLQQTAGSIICLDVLYRISDMYMVEAGDDRSSGNINLLYWFFAYGNLYQK